MFKCNICMETYHPSRRVVRILPCGHDFCQECLKSLHEDDLIICPDCRKEHHVESIERFPTSYKLMSALPEDADVDAGPHQKRHGRGRKMVDAMKEEQRASLLSAKPSVIEKIQALVKYRSSVEDISVHLDELVDMFDAMVKLTQHARGGLALEAEKVTKCCNDGRIISKEIDNILLKLSAATTLEQVAEAVDQGEAQIEAAEDWINQCGLAHPDVSTIHLAAKVREVFTKGLRKMIRCLQELQLPLAAETLCRLKDFVARDDLTYEDGAQGDLVQEDGAQGDLVQEDGAQGDLVQEDGAQGDLVQDDGAQSYLVQDDGAQGDLVQDDGAQGDLVQEDGAQSYLVQDDGAQGDLVQEDGAQSDLVQEDGAQGDPVQEDGAQSDLVQEDGARDDMTQHGASKADTAVKSIKMTVQLLRRGGDQVEELLTAGSVFAVYHHEGRHRYARITRHHNQLCIHHLHDQEPPAHAHTVLYSKLVTTQDTGSLLVFLDLSWPGSPARRVTLRLHPDNPLATQFFLLATGQQGPSYANTRLEGMGWEGGEGEYVWGGNYDGRGGRAIVPGLREHRYEEQQWIAGVVEWWWEGGDLDHNGARFHITTRHNPGKSIPYPFGQVDTGLEVVREAAALGDDSGDGYGYVFYGDGNGNCGVKNVTITDCGVLVPC